MEVKLDDIVILEVEIGQFIPFHKSERDGEEWYEPLTKAEMEEVFQIARGIEINPTNGARVIYTHINKIRTSLNLIDEMVRIMDVNLDEIEKL